MIRHDVQSVLILAYNTTKTIEAYDNLCIWQAVGPDEIITEVKSLTINNRN